MDPPPPEWILCLRHGEKPIDRKGDEGEGLSLAGERRAEWLAGALAPGGSLLPEGAPPPDRIYVPNPKDGKPHRGAKTMEPLAVSLGFDPVPHGRDDVGGLCEAVLKCKKRLVVICWEHDALVGWLQRFAGMVDIAVAGERLPFVEWKKGEFDVMWELRRTPGHTYDFFERAQGCPFEEVYFSDGRTLGCIERAKGLFAAQPDPAEEACDRDGKTLGWVDRDKGTFVPKPEAKESAAGRGKDKPEADRVEAEHVAGESDAKSDAG